MKRENAYQVEVRKEIERRLPGCLILKNDANYLQGVPDLLVLYNDRWAMLEVKKSAKEAHQPNQDYYVQHFADMSFAAFIYPENEQEVLDALQKALQSRNGRSSRLSKR